MPLTNEGREIVEARTKLRFDRVEIVLTGPGSLRIVLRDNQNTPLWEENFPTVSVGDTLSVGLQGYLPLGVYFDDTKYDRP